jgi:hypothetical protein
VRRSCDGVKLKLGRDGGDSDGKKCKRGYGGVCGGVWQSQLLAGIWTQAVGFVLKNLASVALKMFSHLIYFLNKFYTFSTFSAI